MGDVSIIARRHADGHVEYGWSGNGGYFKMVGVRLLIWYSHPETVDYLFGLGQTRMIGRPGGNSWLEAQALTGEPFWIGDTEREIFGKIMFVDYGYFYDLDQRWYYIIPGPFRIKVPLELIEKHLDENDYEFEYRRKVEDQVLRYMLTEYKYKEADSDFKNYIEKKGYCVEKVMEDISENDILSARKLYEHYREIYDYFDDWVLIKANEFNSEITDIIVKRKLGKHIETCEW
ncbi:hypothetical protein [uncultured Eubacterium sp.]|uniref:hypothetical protein n=1 Tax=uncultured Eubacterium sp. TaxID=165185 RepID=UPI0025CF9C71|nr:hypothetical protein [uncultured Eubacterium sp.]